MRNLLISTFALICVSAAPAKPVAEAPAADGPVICRIVSRHETIIVKSSRSGPTYSLQTATGTTLVPAANLNELAMRNPQLHQTVSTMQANTAWAGIDIGD